MNRQRKSDRIATIQASEIKLDVSKVSVTSVISTEARDRSQDIVITDGIDTSNHSINPIVLLEHEYPIGVARTPEGIYTVERHPGFLLGTTYFDEGNPLSIESFRLIEQGILNGASIGFVVKKAGIILAEPGVVEIAIDDDGDRVTKERFGIRYDAVELVEYSHTILPDNPEALTVAVQKSRIGGSPMSPTIKRLLSPYVIETPASVSVPAEIEQIQPDTEIKAMPDDYLDENKDQQGEPTPQPAPEDDSKAAEPEPDASADERPPGAQLLDGVYTRLLEMAQYLEDAGGSKKQENPDILAFVESMVPQIDDLCQSIADTYDSLYPDLESLTGHDEPDGDETGDAPPDNDGDEPEGKRIRRKLAKRIETYRKHRVGLKPAEVPAKPDGPTKEELAAVQKQLDKLDQFNAKLLKLLRAARSGR